MSASSYPFAVDDRFELRSGKFGQYFFDKENNIDLPLWMVLDKLNRYALRKAQLAWYVTEYGEVKRPKKKDAPNAG